MRSRNLACVAGWIVLSVSIVRADVELFEKKIRPVFVEHCFKCHSAGAKKLKGGLRLDTVAGIRKGGDSGPLFVPGKPKESLIVTALRHEETAMPPSGKLSDTIIGDVVAWIERGAALPAEVTTGPAPRRESFRISDDDRNHWAFQPLKKTAVPEVKADTPIDCYLQAKRQSAGLTPAKRADKYALLRRITYDLIGLPPTVEQINAFLADDSPDALPRVVDRLLASREFGVHWGRHWLDGVRYATDVDKSGRYREWVIRSFNDNLPYDRFLMMQLAGDLLPAETTDPAKIHVSGASLDGIAATGLLSLAVFEKVARDLAVAEIVDSQIDLVSRQIIGLTLACARCHDHKFDPISTEDYYGLAGIFFSSKISEGKLIADDRLSDEVLTVPLLSKSDDAKNQALQGRIDAVIAEIRSIPGAERVLKVDRDIAELESKIQATRVAATKSKLTAQLTSLRQEEKKARDSLEADHLKRFGLLRDQMTSLEKQKINPPAAMATREGGIPGSNREKIGNAPVLIRGDFRREGKIVPRRFPVILAGERQTAITSGSGRLELAKWIVQADNPLTSRVAVNRIWRHLFGEGLVRTPGNFGRLGEKPTHPELLDYLATRFIEQGWSVKKLIREMILTEVYQLSSMDDPAQIKADPANMLLSRMNRKRLTYESIRDSVYFVSEQLGSVSIPSGRTKTRTMFEPVERSKRNEAMIMFDGPDPKEIISERADSTTATQALYLMNNELMLQAATRIAEAIQKQPDLTTEEARLNYVYRKVIGRRPTGLEVRLASSFIEKGSWSSYIHVLMCTNEFVYVD